MKKFIAVGFALSSLLFIGVGVSQGLTRYACAVTKDGHFVKNIGICFDQKSVCQPNCTPPKGYKASCQIADATYCNSTPTN